MQAPPSLLRRGVAAALLALVVGGCSPIYEPSYRLEPPASTDVTAQQCVAGCAAAQSACLIPASEQAQNCDNMATLRQEQCRNWAQIDYMICQSAFAPQGTTCFYRLCDRPICARTAMLDCEVDYRRCFAACGGTVVEEPRCVANCPS